MGNNSAKNDDFSKSSQFDMNNHRQAMQRLQSNYNEANINFQPSSNHQARVEVTQFKKVKRTCSIYKPSIKLEFSLDRCSISFEYDSDQGNKLEIYFGVTNVDQAVDTQMTLRIQSRVYFQERLGPGKKIVFQNAYSLGYPGLEKQNLIIRMNSHNSDERTQYSLKRIGHPNQWKVILQKLQFNGIVTQLENVYKGDEQGNECIICLSEQANTLIQPCNHLCVCRSCVQALKKSTNKCPICRNAIANFKVIVSN